MIPTPTPTLLEQLVDRVATATNHLAETILGCNATFWGQPTEVILAELNRDISVTMEVFGAQEPLAQACNDSLSLLESSKYTSRAPVTKGRADIVFDGTSFVVVPPTEPESV